MSEVKALPKHVQFAGEIADLAEKGEYDFNATLNGLAIASASCLVDLIVDDDGNVRTEDIDAATERFVQTLQSAIKFASEQVKQIVAARKAAE